MAWVSTVGAVMIGVEAGRGETTIVLGAILGSDLIRLGTEEDLIPALKRPDLKIDRSDI